MAAPGARASLHTDLNGANRHFFADKRMLLSLRLSLRGLLGPLLRRLARLLRPQCAWPQCSYYDPKSGATFPLVSPRWCAEATTGPVPLMLTPLPGISRRQIATSTRSLWRYAAAFPLPCPEPISLGEGCTPLVARSVGEGAMVHFKCEWFSPTCSFKDRGTSVMLSMLRRSSYYTTPAILLLLHYSYYKLSLYTTHTILHLLSLTHS